MTKKNLRTHKVDVELQAFELSKAGTALKINVYEDIDGIEVKLGELQVGRGSITWWRRNAKKSKASFTWREFAKRMEG